MNDISPCEIVRCDCCNCILDSDFANIGTCPSCINEQELDAYEADWLEDVPTPWLDNDEEDNY